MISGKDEYQLMYTNKQIESCENAIVAINNPVRVSKGNLGQMNASAEIKFNPVVSGDLNTVAFMGEHRFYNGVYVAKKIDGLWARPLNITPSIQSDGNQYVVSLNHDGSKILLAWIDQFQSDIFITEWENGRWNRSYSIGKPVNTKYFESHACFSPDEQSIYFTSNRKESLGGMDIFRCDRLEDGTWGNVTNLGEVINTPLNEESPFISPDGNRLYFSSQGHSTIGGYDMFYSELQPDGSWGAPVNPGYPLNTPDDDLAFAPVGIQSGNEFSMFAKGDDAQKDIFKFDIIPAGVQPQMVAFDVPDVKEELIAEEEVEEAEVEVVTPMEEVTVEKPKIEEYIIKPIFFDFDSYALTTAGKKKLDFFAELLFRFPNLKVDVIGHTDAIGTFEYNQRLSVNRATAVSNYLSARGVSKERLKVIGRSKSEPAAINRTPDNSDCPEGRQLNRRVQFKVSLIDQALIIAEDVEVPDHLKIK
ncbi:MAG TPA: hypothetical protein ENN61_03330 [Bacteroidaceae bacterium]|nr:hypothetical protein [Bacteroidaceae bacterium]